MYAIWHKVYDALFPPRAWDAPDATASSAQLRARLTLRLIDRDLPCVALLRYRDPLVRTTLHALKYGNQRACAAVFGALLAEVLAGDALPQARGALLVPMPLTRESRRTRGYNQCELIARACCDLLPEMSCDPEALLRANTGERQSRQQSREARRHNADAAAFYAARSRVAGRTILLLDDVVATGGTMRRAHEALADAGAREVICLALMR